jgi:signal transduction histidine kinase
MEQRRDLFQEIRQFENYLSKLKDAETGQRGFVITGDANYLEPYEEAISYLQSAELEEFMARQAASADPHQAERIQLLREKERQKLQELAEVIEKRKAQGFKEAKKKVADNTGLQHMNGIRALARSIIREKEQLIQEIENTIAENTNTTLLFFILGDILSIFLIGLCLIYLYFYINKLEQKDKQLSLTARELNHSLAAHQAILNAANYAIITVDTNGIITSFNPAAEKMLGYSKDELIGKSTSKIFYEEKEIHARAAELSMQLKTKIADILDVLFVLAKNGLNDTHEWTYIRKDGTSFPGLRSVAAIKNEAGEIIGYVSIISDITEQKEIEKMKNELVAIASHELRSPLAAIKGTFDLLSQEKQALSEKTQRIIEIGKKNCERLTRVADDLTEFQQIKMGKLKLNMRKMNFSVFLSKVIQANTALAQQSKVELNCQLVPKTWFIEADEERLMQAMNKLIFNAISYSENKGMVDISAYKIDSKIHVEIKNEGQGIAQEMHDKLFQPFVRDPLILRAEKKGTGLELNLAKTIIEYHRGIIGFDRNANGVVFWFELPMLESGMISTKT